MVILNESGISSEGLVYPTVGVKAVIRREDDNILMLQKAPGYPDGVGVWDLPGGLIRQDEDPKKALLREVMEETGFGIQIIEINGVW